MAVLKKNKKSHLLKNMFLDEAVDIQRYDEVKYPQMDKITDKQLGFFWRPEEVSLQKIEVIIRSYLNHRNTSLHLISDTKHY